MKKALFAIILFSTFYKPAYAVGTDVQEVLQSSITINVVNISSFTPTQVDPTSIIMNYRTTLVIQNLDLTNKIYCSQKSNVTTSTGFMLPESGGLISLPISAQGITGRLTLYCITANTSGSSKLAVIQAY